MTTEPALWGIHAGRSGDADKLFFTHKYIAIGWAMMGDLSRLAHTRDAFRERVAEVFPEKKPAAIPNNVGQLYRFVHEMKNGDGIIYPCRTDRRVHLGRITGAYCYNPTLEPGYPHLRAVQWIRDVPRSQFSQGALYEIGSAMSLFQVRNYADEYRAVLHGTPATPPPVTDDETVAPVAEDIEETTRDFILKRLAQELKGHPFADFVAHLLNTMGYRTRVSPAGPDGGIDIVAHKDELGFEPPIIKVQVKSSESSIDQPTVSALKGSISTGEYGLLVTLGTFTAPARNFARSHSNLRLIDGDELVKLIFQHYNQFDARYKGLLPLRRVYVPEMIETDN